MRRSLGGRLAALALAGLLASCASGPQAPLLSPIEEAHSYGYRDAQTGPDSYEVTYLGPSQETLRLSPEADADAARTRAADLALWHAAQIAEQRGFLGFRVSQTRSNVDIYVRDYDPYYGPYWGPGWGWPHRWGYPWGYPYPYGPTPYATIQPQVTVDIRLLNDLAPGDYNAADVISELRARYPQAEGGVVQSR
jgi:hypothetical protein